MYKLLLLSLQNPQGSVKSVNNGKCRYESQLIFTSYMTMVIINVLI